MRLQKTIFVAVAVCLAIAAFAVDAMALAFVSTTNGFLYVVPTIYGYLQAIPL